MQSEPEEQFNGGRERTLKVCGSWRKGEGHRHICDFRKGHPGAHSCWCFVSWEVEKK